MQMVLLYFHYEGEKYPMHTTLNLLTRQEKKIGQYSIPQLP